LPSDISTESLAEKIFDKIKGESTFEDMVEAIVHGWFKPYMEIYPGNCLMDGEPDYHCHFTPDEEIEKVNRDDNFEKIEEINYKRARAMAKAFIDNNKGKYFVVMNFSDHDGEEVEEHANVFQRVDHIDVSYH
jgi:hypothetical protein